MLMSSFDLLDEALVVLVATSVTRKKDERAWGWFIENAVRHRKLDHLINGYFSPVVTPRCCVSTSIPKDSKRFHKGSLDGGTEPPTKA